MENKEVVAADLIPMLKDALGSVVAETVEASMRQAREQVQKAGVTERDDVAVAMRKMAAAQPIVKGAPQHLAGRFMRAAAKNFSHLSPDNIAQTLKSEFGDEDSAKVYGAMIARHKALGESSFVSGGALVPPEFRQEVIEVLRAQVVVRSLGANVVPMSRGSMTLPYGNSGITATNTVENAVQGISQPTFGQIQMVAKKIRAITPVSNDLLNDASPLADAFIQNDMAAAMALQEDINFLRGTGLNGQMRGLRSLAGSSFNATNAAGTAGGSTTTEVIKDLMTMMQLVANNNIRVQNGGFVWAPRTELALMSLRDLNGGFLFREEMLAGKLWGNNFAKTTTMPINLNTGALSSKESEVLFADFSKIVIGDTQELSIQPFPGGTYYDDVAATFVSGISSDQTVVVAQSRSDIAARYRGQEICLLTQCTWGA